MVTNVLPNNNIMSKEQDALSQCVKDGLYQCPSCKSQTIRQPSITNEEDEDDKTQVYCPYGCGYIYLEDYINNK
jgi:hypothetical protein